MSDCLVTCRTCRTDTGPKTWRWLCEDCAAECQDRHRTQTGHQTELLITESVADRMAVQFSTAYRVRYG